MITTVTTVTTVTTITALGLTAAVSIAVVILLALFLTTKELAGARSSGSSLRIARFASIGILPLMMAFATIVIVKIIEVLA
ncbi:hypothetical protein ACFLWD_02720 [Chloroflexota bacterium]